MNISICVPTRGRPHHVQRLIENVGDTSRSPDQIEFCFYCDDDDTDTLEKLLELQQKNNNIRFMQGPRIVFSDTWNRCYQLATADIIMMASDDIVFRTKDWDQIILSKFAVCSDKILFVYGDDLKQGELLGTHGFLHRAWITACGYFTPPYFSADYCDTWITAVARQLKRDLFLPGMIIEHMHVSMKKSNMDDTARDRVIRSRRDDNRGIFYSSEKTQEREHQIKILGALLDPNYQIGQ